MAGIGIQAQSDDILNCFLTQIASFIHLDISPLRGASSGNSFLGFAFINIFTDMMRHEKGVCIIPSLKSQIRIGIS